MLRKLGICLLLGPCTLDTSRHSSQPQDSTHSALYRPFHAAQNSITNYYILISTDRGISGILLDESPSEAGTWKLCPLWMDANVLKTADHCWPPTLQDILAIWSLERGWRSLEVRSFHRTALEAPSQLAPKWALYEWLPPKMFSYFAKDWLIFDWFDRA